VELRRAALALVLLSAACSKSVETKSETRYADTQDHHSFSNPQQVRVRHVALDLDVSFAERVLRGTVTLTVERRGADDSPLVLDTRDLKIVKAEASTDGTGFGEARFELGQPDSILGTPLRVFLPGKSAYVRIQYETSPGASGLQWLEPAQTATKRTPFLYSQSQAIHARSWIPLQDSPGVRVTYSARIRTPKDLLAVMSARNDHNAVRDGEYTFEMPQAIPSYLIAIGVGDLRYKAISRRSGVYAEPPVLDKAAREFEDTEKMIQAAERLFGPYRWEEYDMLMLPPSFPFGGMENPRLTFLTPTVLAGDKSLVGLISHELAHSWSGNLVTNATWRDFWLNEGFTTYLERRIQEAVYGKARSEMEALLERRDLEREMKDLPPQDEILYIDLRGRDPDDGMTGVPYTKGMLLLRRIEEVFGRERFDAFLRSYFDHFAFQSITTGDFVDYLRRNLFDQSPELAAKIDLDNWLTEPGLPDTAPVPSSDALEKIEQFSSSWLRGQTTAAGLPAKDWSTQEWLQFLTSLPDDLSSDRMAELDRAFHLTKAGNNEILAQWLLMAVRSGYQPAYPVLERFLIDVGRRKYIRPLYQELVKTPEGRKRAESIYAKARPGYHPISAATIDDVLKKGEAQPAVKK
jgi:leukotriene A-4 hydrolase/aminopeptidase